MSVRRTTVFLAAAATAVVLALSGCGSDSQKDSAPTSADKPAAANGAAGAGPADQRQAAGEAQQEPLNQAQGQEKGDAGAEQKAPDSVDTSDRAIIYSGTMTVQVKDVNEAATKAIAFAVAAGGFVGGDNRQIDGDSSTATLTLRVPAAKFQSTLEQVKTVGEEKGRQLSAQDVTDQVADVDSRIKTAQASVDRIRALMARAQTIGEITALESELSRRESDLESLQARKRRLDGLTALSTITVFLHGPQAPVVSKEDTGIMVGLRNGWHAFVASLRVALTVLGWLLPWVVFIGGPVYLIIWLFRRYRRTHPLPPRLMPVPAPPAPVYAGRPVPSVHPVAPGPRWTPPAQPAPVSGPPAPTTAEQGGKEPVSDARDGAEAEPTRAPEAAAPHRPEPRDEGEGTSGPEQAR
ncbi:hypothetical protein GCM10022255_023520 [Dactylosporangium darangshiense]|uniref:DUF4349 domain-containing protein n=1 Tax=Dactylosporangium darangshiense TaxID=579108 RepID=A0ABP8D4T1_9ACTN